MQTYREFENALITKVNDGLITAANHTFDNSFLEVDAKTMFRQMQDMGCELIGISFSCPYVKYHDDDIALVFRDSEDEVCWIHLTRLVWEGFVSDCYGENKAQTVLSNCFRQCKT